jgi:hypothetical protein
MPAYTITEAATQIAASTTGSPSLSTRVQVALIKYAAGRVAGATGAEAAYIRRIANNPVGEANAVLPLLVSNVSVTVTTGPPTDSELSTGIAGIWSFLTG